MLDKIRKDLTVENPEYTRSFRTKAFKKYAVEQFLRLYVDRGSSIIVPRGYMNRALFHKNDKDYEIIDNTICPELSAALVFKKKLRDYQERAIEDVTLRRYGILEASTGAGKTIMALSTIPIRNTKTLILVHSKELLYQWREAIQSSFGINCGLIGDGNKHFADITVGIINSVHKMLDKSREDLNFGYIIYDECHRTLGSMWLDVINTLYPKYHLGVTATPFRNDETTKALFAILGPKLHVVDRKELEEIGAICIPNIIRVNTFFYTNEGQEIIYSNLITELTNDIHRNNLIVEKVVQEYMHYKEPILIVSDRKEHCELLFNLIDAYRDLNPILLHGSIKKSERTKKVEEFKKGKFNVLIATVSLIGEGFDSPSLGSLFLTTPVKFAGRLLQVVGRILRPSGTEKPRVYDVRDTMVKMLRYSGFARDRQYKEKGWIE